MSDDGRITWQKLVQVLRAEMQGVHTRLQVLEAIEALLPRRNSGAARSKLYRVFGFRIGEGTALVGRPRITGPDALFPRLTIGRDCVVDVDCVLDLEERVTIGDSVTLGPGTMVLTSTHELGPRDHRAGPVTRAPVVVGDGAWLGARSIVLPGVTIGVGAIVEVGAVVNRDVEPHTRVAGSPAALVERLNPPDAPARPAEPSSVGTSQVEAPSAPSGEVVAETEPRASTGR